MRVVNTQNEDQNHHRSTDETRSPGRRSIWEKNKDLRNGNKEFKTTREKMAALHNNWLGEPEGPNFGSSYNQRCLRPRILGVSVPGSGRAQGTLHGS